MATAESRGYCAECRKWRLVRQEVRTPNHVAHAIITLGLCGLWAPCWFLLTVFPARGAWHCPRCGSTDIRE